MTSSGVDDLNREFPKFIRAQTIADLDRDLETILDDLAAQARSILIGGYATPPVRTFFHDMTARGYEPAVIARRFERCAKTVRTTYDRMEQAASNLQQAEAEGTLIPLDEAFFADLRHRIEARRTRQTDADETRP